MIVFQQINIQNNPVQYISPYCLRGIQLRHILISHGHLKQAPSITPVGASVETVQFANNDIADISDEYFNNCSKLEGATFSGNMFQRLPNLSPIALTLQRLYFPRNLISDVTSLKMATFPELRYIDLQSNQITNFLFHSDTLPELILINLAFNRLTQIDELYMTISVFRVPVSAIFISHNSWNCSHVYAWVAQSMHTQGKVEPTLRHVHCSVEFVWSSSNASKTAICDLHKTFCSSPPALVNCSIMDIGKLRQDKTIQGFLFVWQNKHMPIL